MSEKKNISKNFRFKKKFFVDEEKQYKKCKKISNDWSNVIFSSSNYFIRFKKYIFTEWFINHRVN